MPNKTLTLTIVIPAYNEENYLAACLDSIAAQSVSPDEVIMVDNNSTDGSVAVAKKYDFVKLIHEPRQHQSFGQQTGFNAAESDIIGRIDADSVLSADWVQRVKQHFTAEPGLVGLTGGTLPYDMAARSASSRVFATYNHIASRLAGSRMLWGANCAVRRSAWRKISTKVTTGGNIWEDYDLSFCLAPLGAVRKVDDIDVASSFRSVQKPLLVQSEYQFRVIRTFRLHTGFIRTVALLAVWSTMYMMFLLVRFDRYILAPLIKLAGIGKKSSTVVSLDAE